jgi:hypothetical protein
MGAVAYEASPFPDLYSDASWALRLAAGQGRAEDVARLLDDPGADPNANDGAALFEAARRGFDRVVALLLGHPRVDPNAGRALREAAIHGHTGVVRLFLGHPLVDPAAEDNAALQCASLYGRWDVAALLLEDPRVNPAGPLAEEIRHGISAGMTHSLANGGMCPFHPSFVLRPGELEPSRLFSVNQGRRARRRRRRGASARAAE